MSCPGVSAHGRDEGDTAGIVLVLGTIEPGICGLHGEEPLGHV